MDECGLGPTSITEGMLFVNVFKRVLLNAEMEWPTNSTTTNNKCAFVRLNNSCKPCSKQFLVVTTGCARAMLGSIANPYVA